MGSTRQDVQPVDVVGAVFAIVSTILAVLHIAASYLAPGLMAVPLWSGSFITWSVLLGVFAISVPVPFAWLCVRND